MPYGLFIKYKVIGYRKFFHFLRAIVIKRGSSLCFMEEKTLLKIALICSIVGVFIIFIFAGKLEPSLINISSISQSFIDKDVKIRGTVSSFRITSSVLMLDVRDETGVIKVVAFDKEDFEADKDQAVEVIGKVKEYQGVLEIEAKNILFL